MAMEVQYGQLNMRVNKQASLWPNMPQRGNLPFLLTAILSGPYSTFSVGAVGCAVAPELKLHLGWYTQVCSRPPFGNAVCRSSLSLLLWPPSTKQQTNERADADGPLSPLVLTFGFRYSLHCTHLQGVYCLTWMEIRFQTWRSTVCVNYSSDIIFHQKAVWISRLDTSCRWR